jgi:hypothetical protein
MKYIKCRFKLLSDDKCLKKSIGFNSANGIVKRMPELASSSLTRQLILRIAPEIIRQLFE